jgi:hypothetical protein
MYVKGMNTLHSREQNSEVEAIDECQERFTAHRKLPFNFLKFSIVALLIKMETVTGFRALRYVHIHVYQYELSLSNT